VAAKIRTDPQYSAYFRKGRTFDNWKNLRPPQVDDEKSKERTKLLEELEKRPDHALNLVNIPGPPDSRMGSEIPYFKLFQTETLTLLYVGID
jgi:hypothetical protein